VVGQALGWDAARIRQEVERAAALLRERHGMRLEDGPAVRAQGEDA